MKPRHSHVTLTLNGPNYSGICVLSTVLKTSCNVSWICHQPRIWWIMSWICARYGLSCPESALRYVLSCPEYAPEVWPIVSWTYPRLWSIMSWICPKLWYIVSWICPKEWSFVSWTSPKVWCFESRICTQDIVYRKLTMPDGMVYRVQKDGLPICLIRMLNMWCNNLVLYVLYSKTLMYALSYSQYAIYPTLKVGSIIV